MKVQERVPLGSGAAESAGWSTGAAIAQPQLIVVREEDKPDRPVFQNRL